MPRTTRNHLFGDVAIKVAQEPNRELWIAHDPVRRRYAVYEEPPRGRLRSRIGPYSGEVPMWQLRQDVEAAVRDLNQRDATRYAGTQDEGGIAEAFASVWGRRV